MRKTRFVTALEDVVAAEVAAFLGTGPRRRKPPLRVETRQVTVKPHVRRVYVGGGRRHYGRV